MQHVQVHWNPHVSKQFKLVVTVLVLLYASLWTPEDLFRIVTTAMGPFMSVNATILASKVSRHTPRLAVCTYAPAVCHPVCAHTAHTPCIRHTLRIRRIIRIYAYGRITYGIRIDIPTHH